MTRAEHKRRALVSSPRKLVPSRATRGNRKLSTLPMSPRSFLAVRPSKRRRRKCLNTKKLPSPFHAYHQNSIESFGRETTTERAGTGESLDNHEPGIYVDVVSGEPLFASSDKFEVGLRVAELHEADRGAQDRQRADATPRTGWSAPKCARSHGDSHLGHVFDDGPADAWRPALLHQLGFAALHPSRRHEG